MLQGHKAIGGPCVPKMPRALLCLSFPLSSWYNGREQWWLGRTPPPPCPLAAPWPPRVNQSILAPYEEASPPN